MVNLEELIQINLINILEEENEGAVERRTFHRTDPFTLPDNQFMKLFRLPKHLVENLIEMLQPYLIPASRISALSIRTKMLIALRFYASGSYQTDIALNIYTAVSQASVSRCVTEISEALNRPEIFQNWVKFPRNLEELRAVRSGFFEKFQFPGVVGAIDCTHVAIIAPRNEENLYVNRKQYHSINVQLVCDSNMKIIHANARYPGSTNDSFIWNNSSLKEFFFDLHSRGNTNYFLLGDSGYALRSYMMTPIINPEPQPNTPECRYNVSQMKTRALIERCNGLLKMRFTCLLKHRVLHYQPNIASKIINACLVLHNMCIEHKVQELAFDEMEDDTDFGLIEIHNTEDEQAVRRVNPELAKGKAVQKNLINKYFTQ